MQEYSNALPINIFSFFLESVSWKFNTNRFIEVLIKIETLVHICLTLILLINNDVLNLHVNMYWRK